MIRVSYVPQVALPGRSLEYAWQGRVLHIRLQPDGLEETVDLTPLAPGDRATVTTEVIPYNPVLEAYVDDVGDLHVTLLHWYQPGEPDTRPEEVYDG